MEFRKLSRQKIRKITNDPKLKKLLERVNVADDRGCWFINEDWSLYTSINREPGHRYIYKTFVGNIEEGKIICHKCDRPGCINPDHLYQGTIANNNQDWQLKKKLTRARRYIKFREIADEKSHEYWDRVKRGI